MIDLNLEHAVNEIKIRVNNYNSQSNPYVKWDSSSIYTSRKIMENWKLKLNKNQNLIKSTSLFLKKEIPESIFTIFNSMESEIIFEDFDLMFVFPWIEMKFMQEFSESTFNDDLELTYFHPGIKKQLAYQSLLMFARSEFEHMFFIDIGNQPATKIKGQILHLHCEEDFSDICIINNSLSDFLIKLGKLPIFKSSSDYHQFDLKSYFRSEAILRSHKKLN